MLNHRKVIAQQSKLDKQRSKTNESIADKMLPIITALKNNSDIKYLR